MKNKKALLITIFVLILFALLIGRLSGIFSKQEPIIPEPNQEKNTYTEQDFSFLETPEHMKNPELHNLTLEIISPEEEKIFPAQARMYEAFLKGNAKYESAKILCHWKFYLNENNEEVLYKEMENTSNIYTAENKVCGFTSTFMDRIGKLRVELTAELTNYNGNTLESVTGEKNYVVAK